MAAARSSRAAPSSTSGTGQALVSLVGFLFADTRVRGLAIPGPPTLRGGQPQVLRAPSRWLRARPARGRLRPRARPELRDRRHRSFPLQRTLPVGADASSTRLHADVAASIEYAWRYGGSEFSLDATVEGPAAIVAADPKPSSSPSTTGATRASATAARCEYEVEHPRWRVWTTPRVTFRGPAAQLYGPVFGEALAGAPRSAFVATDRRSRSTQVSELRKHPSAASALRLATSARREARWSRRRDGWAGRGRRRRFRRIETRELPLPAPVRLNDRRCDLRRPKPRALG